MKLIKFFMVLITITGLSIMVSAEAPAATGADIVYQETNTEGGGWWEYDFTFSNTSTNSESLYNIFLDFNEPVTVTGSSLGDGWIGIVWWGTNERTYMDTMSQSSSGYIDAGNSLGVFSFTADQQIGDIGWYAEFRDTSGGLSNLTGTATNTPPVVPEPVSTILFITGGAVMAARKRFGRKREIA